MLTWPKWNSRYHKDNPWHLKNREQRKQLYKEYKLNYECPMWVQANYALGNIPAMNNANHSHDYYDPHSLATLPMKACSPAPAKPWPALAGTKQEEGNTPMRYDYNAPTAVATVVATPAVSEVQKQRDYLMDRADTAYRAIYRTLDKMFGMDKQTAPQTFEQLIDAIKNDKFEITKEGKRKLASFKGGAVDDEDFDDGYSEGQWYWGPTAFIKWTGFAGPDHDGYAAAYAELKVAYQDLKDTIMVREPEDAFDAFETFKKFVPSNAPTVH